MVKTPQQYGFQGMMEDLAEAFPNLRYELVDRIDPDDINKHQDCIIDASDFDINMVGRFMTFDNNNIISLFNLPIPQLVTAVIPMFKMDGNISVYKNSDIHNYANKSPDDDRWDCNALVLNRHKLPQGAKSLELKTEQDIIGHFQDEPSCEICIYSPDYRLVARLYNEGKIVYRAFGLNNGFRIKDLGHETPQDLSVISPAVNELPFLYGHIQFLRKFGDVEAMSRDDHICVNAYDPEKKRTGGIRLKFSKV